MLATVILGSMRILLSVFAVVDARIFKSVHTAMNSSCDGQHGKAITFEEFSLLRRNTVNEKSMLESRRLGSRHGTNC